MAEAQLPLAKSDTTYNLKVDDIPDAETNTGFLDLSAELRNNIYDLCLSDRQSQTFIPTLCLYTHRYKLERNGHGRECTLIPQLLSTCLQIYSEAKPVLYGSNTFIVCHYAMAEFVQLMAGSLKLIRHLGITSGSRKDKLEKCLCDIHNFVNLDKLILSKHCLRHFRSTKTALAVFKPFVRSIQEKRMGTDKKQVTEVIEFRFDDGYKRFTRKMATGFLEEIFK